MVKVSLVFDIDIINIEEIHKIRYHPNGSPKPQDVRAWKIFGKIKSETIDYKKRAFPLHPEYLANIQKTITETAYEELIGPTLCRSYFESIFIEIQPKLFMPYTWLMLSAAGCLSDTLCNVIAPVIQKELHAFTKDACPLAERRLTKKYKR